jgi:hypothetical protein
MASTSNKNTPGNYAAEQQINHHHEKYLTYKNSAPAEAYSAHHPGLGVMPAKTARSQLCENYCDVESQLFGIGSTNLVVPQKPVAPEFKSPRSLDFIEGLKVQLPEPLVVEKNQRPYMNY